ncbi:MAG: hypothetical protein ACYDH0_08090 [Candidatus Aminicenantales bacterium]
MKITRLLIAISVAAISAGPAGAQTRLDKVYAVDIRVFEIPPIQSVTQTVPSEGGGIRGITIGGNVTAGFPAETVLVQTEFGSGAVDAELKGLLTEKGYLKRCDLPEDVSWIQTGSYSLFCREKDLGSEAKRTEYYEPAIKPSRENRFWERRERLLTVFPLSVRSGEAALNLKFAADVRVAPLDPGVRQVLLDQDFKIALGKTALVGFPQLRGSEPGRRGTVYILAVCVREQDIGGL